MSVASGRQRSLNISRNSADTSRNSTNGANKKVIRFQMPHSSRVKEVLEKYLVGENIREYEQLVCSIRDNLFEDDEIVALLQEAIQCVSLLNQELRLFVEAILSLNWPHKNKRIVNEYRSFLVNLLCAHNYHTKFAIDRLIRNFIDDGEKEWTNGVPSDEDCQKYGNVHSVINILFKVIPMSREILHQSIVSYYPYLKKSTHQHEVYVHNILWILDYQPEFRLEFFYLLFNRLIILDSNAPRHEIIEDQTMMEDEDIFDFEESSQEKTKHPLAHTLDVCLDKILNYFIIECYDLDSGQLNWEKSKSLYQTMITVFEKVILPTYNIHHVQFTMFFLCSFKITICEAFLGYLWKKVCDPSVPSIHRQSAVAYIASLLARGTFVPISMLKSTMEQMAAWLHKYISTQDGLECVNSDVRVHSVFYNVCQALFYVVAFRHRDLVNTRKNIAFLESLNMGKMVTCRLNPLRVCQPAILQNFAAVTRTYQLAYCYSIMEHNQRNVIPTVYLDEKGTTVTKSAVLDSFFPFDPFLIKRCGSKLSPIYLEYKAEEENGETETKMEEDDDFLNESFKSGVQTPTKTQTNRFSYGTSPGFKYNS